MDALQIIIPAVTGILGLFIGYFLKKSEYERRRRDELADRVSAKRMDIRAKKIEEAQEVINTYAEVIAMLGRIESGTIIFRDEQRFRPEFEKVYPLMNFSPSRFLSLHLLKNSELATLADELSTKVYLEYNKTSDLMTAIRKKEAPDKQATLERIRTFSRESAEIIGDMQRILDKLAEIAE